MKRKRFTDSRILTVLQQAELGVAVSDVTRQMGISEQTFYRWKKQYAGLQSDQVRELKQLQDENTRYGVCFSGLTCAETGGSLHFRSSSRITARSIRTKP